MHRTSLLHGPLAKCLAICLLVAGFSLALMTVLGGQPLSNSNGQYLFAEHGRQTLVSQAVYFFANIAYYTMTFCFALAAICGVALPISKLQAKFRLLDPRPNYTRTVALAMAAFMLMQLAAELVSYLVRQHS